MDWFCTLQEQRAPDRAPAQSRIICPPRVTLRVQDRDKSASLEDIRHWLETRFPSQETISDGVTLKKNHNWFNRDTRKELRCKILGCKSVEGVVRRHFPDLVRITDDPPKRMFLVVKAREGYGDPNAHSMLPQMVSKTVNKKRKRIGISKAHSRNQRNRS